MIVFDIETGALPWHELSRIIAPFDEEKAVPHPGEFNAASVAIGNLKDEAKIQAKIDEARGKHALELKSVSQRRAAARNDYAAKCMERAALSAMTGTVKAIGIRESEQEKNVIIAVDPSMEEEVEGAIGVHSFFLKYWKDEKRVLRSFWQYYADHRGQWVGHNIIGFDLPFLIRRSWILGEDVPGDLMNGRYFSGKFVDTMEKWNCGARDYVKLADICKALGGGDKPDDCTGADFARLFDNGGEDRLKALAYLANDLEMTQHVAECMGII